MQDKNQASVDEDKRMRLRQYEDFCNQHMLLKNMDPKEIGDLVKDVLSLCEIMEHVQDFISSCSEQDEQCQPEIIFNGHGCKDGLRLLDEDQCIPLNSIIDCIREICHENHNLLPFPVAIVFAQCYGHLHTFDVPPKGLNVISLSSSKTLKTVGSSRSHYFLNEYARDYNRQVDKGLSTIGSFFNFDVTHRIVTF